MAGIAHQTLLSLILLLYIPHIAPLDSSYARTINSPPEVQPSGATCSQRFMWRSFSPGSARTVATARALCKDYGTNGPAASSIGEPQLWRSLRLRDITSFFRVVSKRYNKTPLAKSFSFFAESGDMCLTVKFKAYPVSNRGEYTYSSIDLKFRSRLDLSCPVSEVDNAISHIVCVHDNCTLPPPPPQDRTDVEEASSGLVVGATIKDCLAMVRRDHVPMDVYNRHRLWAIVAFVACNLVSMAFLAGLIHFCLKYRTLRKHFRLIGASGGLGGGSLAGTSSPTPAVRHLGSTGGQSGQMLTMSHGGSMPFPEYPYSSIARRKYRTQQRQHQQQHPDEETMSYRSDHTRLLMSSPGSTNGGPNHHMMHHQMGPHHQRHGSIAGSVGGGGGTLHRQNSGAVSPPRGWGGNEDPSTPGSMRRHGSVSGMSIVSASGHPRRNGTLPALPHQKPGEPPATMVY